MRSSSILLPIIIAIAPLGCASETSAPSELIGGREVTSGYEATLYIESTAAACTAAKVGPRHILTAAHCVTDGFEPGSVFWATNARRPWQADDLRELTVEQTHVHEGYKDDCNDVSIADVAVVVIDEPSARLLADVRTANVSARTVAPGTKVTILGYGCEQPIDQDSDCEVGPPDDFDPLVDGPRLKYHKTTTKSAEALSAIGIEPAQRVADHHLITFGMATDADLASGCPGDSGGPVYLDGDTIVGVNAIGWGSEGEPTTAQAHTRLDNASSQPAARWLEDLGVDVRK